jgi:hypothetical protein
LTAARLAVLNRVRTASPIARYKQCTKKSRLGDLVSLYLAIGDAVRTRFNTASRAAVKSALDSATTLAANDLVVARWIADSRKLLASPDRFEYEQWCGGGRATQVVDQPGC